MASQRAAWWLLAVFAASLAGCGPANRAKVTGKVTYEDGTPVTAGEVILFPTDPMAPSPVGHIQPDGSFSLFTDKPGDGATIGKYRVAVSPLGDEYNAKNPRPIDPKYADPQTSGIEFEVKPGTNDLPIKVGRPPGKR